VNGIYRLTPKAAPQRALNVRDNGTANGTAIDVRAAAFTLNQRWQIEKQADGSFKIKAWPGRTDVSQVMDLNAWATSNGAAVTTWQDAGSQNQRWYFEALDDGWWRITPAISTDKCLEVYGTAAAEGSPVDIWGFWGGANQMWRLDPPDMPIPGDANADGQVTLTDARLILQSAGGLSVLPGLPSVRAADVAPKPSAAYRGYGDGGLDTMDAVRVLRYLAGLETAWP
jgi:hypothetical protein